MRSTLILLLSFLIFTFLPAQHLTNTEAQQLIPEAEHIWLKKHNKLPHYIKFSPNKRIDRVQFDGYVKEKMDWDSNKDGWEFIRAESDQLGHHHERFQQTFGGYPVEGSMINIHSQSGRVYAMNGDFYTMKDVPLSANLSESMALEAALDHIDANAYKWEIMREESRLQDLKRGTEEKTGPYTYYPEGELVIAPVDDDFEKGEFRLAWKFDVYAHAPLSRHDVFVDAITGKVMFKHNQIHTVNVIGVAMTGYSGQQTIITDSVNTGLYRLRDSTRGGGIFTWNLDNTTNPANQTDFTDHDNIWNNVNPKLDEYATDVHWGTEMTYDYFLQNFNRNSVDGNGVAINSQVHYGTFGTVNASWNGQTANYYDGGGRPVTCLDVIAHELSHGVTGNSAGLIYRNESGALNESFSDVFGKAVEQWARPNKFTWRVSNDRGSAFRDMSDPNSMGDPRNYLGTDWYNGTADNGGVHTNSGVQNHWFYLLCEGDNSTNDFGDAYSVTKIGFDTAAAVAYRNLAVYLTPNSSYQDAAFYGVQSAVDLYGNCSRIHEAVQNAWHAVGVGKAFSNIAVSDFGAKKVEICSAPFLINFEENSLGASSYFWEFGDGNTSSLANPNHTYAAPGVYNIKLKIDGYCGGKDSIYKSSFITINPPPPSPTVAISNYTVNCLDNVTLSASAPGSLLWSDQFGRVLGKKDSLEIVDFVGNATYYVQQLVEDNRAKFGPVDPDSIGNGAYFNTQLPQGLVFDVLDEVRIKSVWVDANSAGPRTIEIKQGNNVVESITATLPMGKSRLILNADLSVGSYSIVGTGLDLFCNNGVGISYPYILNKLISINSSTSGNNFYCFFYDWEVATFCKSVKVPVNVQAIVPSPVLNQTNVILPCGGSTTVIASGSNGTSWYDNFDQLVSLGDTLNLTNLNASSTFFARSEIEGPLQKVGPANGNALGNGRYFNNVNQRGLFFDVIVPIRLHSVWVDARSSGTRAINIEDGNGALVRSMNINIPAGQGRINLEIDLDPGNYYIWGTDMDLFRNRSFTTNYFPFTINNVITITSSDQGPTSYYYFYDWEVSTLCTSPKIPVNIQINPLSAPTISGGDSVCFDASATLIASSGGASWYDANGDFIAAGQRFTTPALTANTTYFVKGESAEPQQNLGPLNASAVGNGGHHSSQFPAWLEFDVLQPIRLNSVWVDAGATGNRNILLEDGQGNLIQVIPVSIENGQRRLPLGLSLTPGSYRLGGTNMNLFRNSVGGNYPYDISGLISITSSSNGPGFYFYFYDWEVQELPCESNLVAIPLAIRPQINADFSFIQNGPLLTFADNSPAAQAWSWDFGDGNTSPVQNPSHLYDASGTYVVTLTITRGPCTTTHTDTILVEPGMSIGELATGSFQLYPNPGNGHLRIRAEALQSSEMQVIVYDLTGRTVFSSSPVRTIQFDEKIDISHLPSGNYFVKLRVQDAQTIRKYVLNR